MTIRFCAVRDECEEACIFIIFPGHVLPAGRRLSILAPWILTLVSADGGIFLDGAIGLIALALAILDCRKMSHPPELAPARRRRRPPRRHCRL